MIDNKAAWARDLKAGAPASAGSQAIPDITPKEARRVLDNFYAMWPSLARQRAMLLAERAMDRAAGERARARRVMDDQGLG